MGNIDFEKQAILEEKSKLQELAKRLERIQQNDDLKKIIEFLDSEFKLNGSVITLCNCPNASEYLFAREGMRTYRNKLVGLLEETKQALQNAQQENNDE